LVLPWLCPDSALAACSAGAAPDTVSCAATTTIDTTNTNAATALSIDRNQSFNNGGDITAVNVGDVDGFGQALTNGSAGRSITLNQLGDITLTGGVPTNGIAGSAAALNLSSSGGTITYAGTGNVSAGTFGANGVTIVSNGGTINFGTSGTPIAGSFTGRTALSFSSGAGTQNVFLGAGTVTSTGGTFDAIQLQSTSGAVNLTMTGTNLVQTGIFSAPFGVKVATSSGAVNVTSNARIGSGVGNDVFNLGIVVDTQATAVGGAITGAVAINQSGDIWVRNGQFFGAHGIWVNSTNNVDITFGGGATIHVNDAIASGNSFGIRTLGGAAGFTQAVTLGGTITGADIGISNLQTLAHAGVHLTGSGQINALTTGIEVNGAGVTTVSVDAGATVTAGTTGIVANGATQVTIGGAVSAVTALDFKAGANTLTLLPGSSLTGAVNVATNTTSLTFNQSSPVTLASAITGAGSVIQSGSGALTLTGVSTYTGATTVNAGALIVNGSIASSAGLTVNSGIVGGTGTLPSTTINGGTLSPGTSIGTIAVSGNLVMTAAATYLVEVSPSAADRTNVSGSASLAGTVQAVFQPGTYVGKSYTILSAAGGRTGTFSSINSNLSGFTTTLSYTPTDVLLNLTATLGQSGGLNQNQSNVANAVNAFFNSGGVLPPSFATLFGLAGSSLANALSQVSGELATGVQKSSTLSSGLFLNAMLDPFNQGRFGFGATMGNASEEERASAAKSAFAASLKAPPPTAGERVAIWSATYGGYNRTDGDGVVIGSHDVSARAGGFAAGADYRYAPGSVVGVAVAIGEDRWGLGGGLGKGNAEVAQVGGYASTRWYDAYLSAAVAGAWYHARTDRFVTIAGVDTLSADFDAHSIGGRVEAGWRFGTPTLGITPYGAAQVQNVHTPAYGEIAGLGSNAFALNYASESTTSIRSELGAWVDSRHVLSNSTMVVLRARAAWVHDFDPDSRVTALFQTLPGASFVVDGARAAEEAALVSGAAEVRFTNGITLIGKVDGEFSSRSQTVAGTGTLRYAW